MSETSSDASGLAEETWEDWNEEETHGVQSLFCSQTFPDLEASLAFDAAEFKFDLRQYRAQTGATSEYDTIKLINFIRGQVAAGTAPAEVVGGLAAAAGGACPWQSDEYMRPVLVEDELLLHDWEEENEGAAGAASVPTSSAAQLQRENDALRSALAAMQELALQDDALNRLVQEQRSSQAAAPSKPYDDLAAEAGPSTVPTPEAAAAAAVDATYFESYSFFDIHREMLGDKVRTEAYQTALESNPSLIKGATVLDLGCGTGVLSLFAARAGAARVVAVDGSPEIAEVARKICAANGQGGEEGVVTVVSSRVEQLQELPGGGKADVLVSEWMGYALLFESMLDSVLEARDRFLKPGGAVLPDVARIFVAGAGEGATGLGFWRDVYGLCMAPVADSLRQSALGEALVRPVAAADLLTEGQQVASFDLATMAASDQDFTANFALHAGASAGDCHALVLWFDTIFTERFCSNTPVELSTSPQGPQTHWAQTVLVLPEPVRLVPAGAAGGAGGEAVTLQGRISMARRRRQHRCLDISVDYRAVHADGTQGVQRAQLYSLTVTGKE